MSHNSIKTMEEFAEFVGLSRPTISRFFQDPESVRLSTRRRIEQAVDSSGYRPNLLATNLNRQKSKILGIIVPTLFDPFYMAITRRIDQIVTLQGFQAFTLSSDGSPELETEAIKTFTSMNVAGSFIAPLGRKSVRSELRDIKKSMPLVALDTPLDDETSFVGTNNAQSMLLMINYLCRSGQPPVYFDMPDINDNAFQRRGAYSKTMKKLGHKPLYALSGSFDTWDFEKFAFDQTTSILSQGGFATNTVLCANDRLAFGVLAACYQAGVKVGRGADCHLRVAGHDNQPLSAITCPPLTTVSQNYKDIGRIATEILLAKLGETEMPAEFVKNKALLNGELIMRESA